MRRKPSNQLALFAGIDNTVDPVLFDKPVSLIHIANKLTNHQRKCYNALLSRAKIAYEARGDYEADDPITIPWREFKSVLFLKHRTRAYAKEKVEELMSTIVEIDCLGREGIPKKLTLVQLLGETSFIGEGESMYIELNLPKTIRERLRDSDVTAVLDLAQMAKLDSKYSTPLYELCKEALDDSAGEPTSFRIEIADFRKLMGVENEYERVYDLTTRCIDPGVNEIQATTDIMVTYTLERAGVGRKLVAVSFDVRVEKRDPERVRMALMLNEVLLKVRKPFHEHKQVLKSVEDALRSQGEHYVVSNIEYTNKHAKKNYIKYLKDALAEDYGIDIRAAEIAKAETLRKKEEEEKRKREEVEARELDYEEREKSELNKKLLERFEVLPDDKKNEIYKQVELVEQNPYIRRLPFEEQLLHVLREVL